LIERAYKARLYPNKEQRESIERTFGCCRYVWNRSLEAKQKAYEETGKSPSSFELCKQLTKWKQSDAPWLYEVSNMALQQSIRDLDVAFKNFFRRVKKGEKPGYPKFKSRFDNNQSYRLPYDSGNGFRIIDEHHIRIAKLGVVKCRGLRMPEGRMMNITVRRVPSGRYHCSVCCVECPEPEAPPGTVEMLGVDAGVKDLITRSDGVKVANPHALKRLEKKLRREQRRLSRKQKGSANRDKQRVKVARVHEKIASVRKDCLHKATTQAVMDAKAVAVEDLNVRGMMANHKMAKSASDASMSEMIRQLEYKSRWYGRDFVKVDRFYPSTQTCSCCGKVTGPKGLSGLKEREWECPECGAKHDRDLNAAVNIANEGRRILNS